MSTPVRIQTLVRQDIVVVEDGESLSGAASPKAETGSLPVALVTGSGWDTADITFAATIDTDVDGTYVPVYNDEGDEYTIPAIPASTYVALDPTKFLGVHHIKVRSGTAGSPTNQSGDASVTVLFR